MGVSLRPVNLILRAGPGHVYGRPYAVAAMVQVWRDTARITGMVGDGRAILANRADLIRQLLELGVRVVEWERVKDGRTRVVRIKLREA